MFVEMKMESMGSDSIDIFSLTSMRRKNDCKLEESKEGGKSKK
jgi:hypothetical protein